MKKYILIPDPVKSGINRFFEVQSDFFVQASVCYEGVAIVIGGRSPDINYGYAISADKSYLPAIPYLEAKETAAIEDAITNMLSNRISSFLADNTRAVFSIRSCHDELCAELNRLIENRG